MDIKQAIHEYLFDESNFSYSQGPEWQEVLATAEPILAKAVVALGNEWTEKVFGFEDLTEEAILHDAILAENVQFMGHSELVELEEKALELL